MSHSRRLAQPAHLERNQHIFARFMSGRSVGAIASGEGFERFQRLDAARETLAEGAAKPKASQPAENTGNEAIFGEPERNPRAICETLAKPKRSPTQSSEAERLLTSAAAPRRWGT